MRHQVAGRKLGRTTAHRKAMLRNMVVSLIEHGRIKTTLHKAKELRRFAERLVTLAKEDTVHHRRLAFDRLRNRPAVQKLFQTISPSFKERNGGYTRIFKLGARHGDAAKMAYIEFLREDLAADQVTEKAAKTTKKSAKKASQVKNEKSAEKKASASKKTATAKKVPAKEAASAQKSEKKTTSSKTKKENK